MVDSYGNGGTEESVESQKAGFPPFPPSLGNPFGIPTFPQLRLLYLFQIQRQKPGEGKKRPPQKPKTKGGPKDTAELGQAELPKSSGRLTDRTTLA